MFCFIFFSKLSQKSFHPDECIVLYTLPDPMGPLHSGVFPVQCVQEGRNPALLLLQLHAKHVLCCSLHMAPSVEYFFLVCGLIEWLWSGRSPSQCKFKLPADLCKLHLAWACYKLAPYSPCDVNRMEVAKKSGALEMCATKAEAVHYLGPVHTANRQWRNGGHADP